jgi:transcriptional regulator with XRE-family HTH domain
VRYTGEREAQQSPPRRSWRFVRTDVVVGQSAPGPSSRDGNAFALLYYALVLADRCSLRFRRVSFPDCISCLIVSQVRVIVARGEPRLSEIPMADVTRRKKWHEIEKIGQRIREARERLGLTQEQLAELIGKGRDTVSHYEIGDRAIVVTELPALAHALKVPISYFFGNDEPAAEILVLASELNSMPLSKQKAVLERWRYELEWWKNHDLELSESPPND